MGSIGQFQLGLEALMAVTTDPAVFADLARGKLRRKLPALSPRKNRLGLCVKGRGRGGR